MGSKVLFVYATNSKTIRRIVISDDDSGLDQRHVGQGESFIMADKVNGTDLFAATAAVQKATGVTPQNPMCAVLDGSNNVVSMIQADPALDTVKNFTLQAAYHPDIKSGCTYDPNTQLFSAPLTTTPAGTDKDGNPYPQKTTGGSIPKPVIAAQPAKEG